MNSSLNKAYAAVHIPTNYISSQRIWFTHKKGVDAYYYCYVFTRIDAVDKSAAFSYETQINSDPDTVARSKFADNLEMILGIGQSDTFDMSVPKMDSLVSD